MNEDNVPTSLVDLINQLVEPTPPDPVSLLPQTAGWWVLGVLVLVALAYGVGRVLSHWRANAYRRAALRELALAGDDPTQVATILRRAALAAYPRREVAGLTGTSWVTFLCDTGRFPQAAAKALIRSPYDPGSDAEGLKQAAEGWLRSHRRPQ
jgi:hypothetical protein